jgi:predicted aldo/keto reductase-like oxidoreductase
MPLSILKKEEEVERIFEDQLRKCRVDYFDYYLLHSVNKAYFKVAEDLKVYEKLKEKQRQGKIRHLGFSFHDSPEFLDMVSKKYDWEFVQIQLNYLDWDQQHAREQYTILESNGIPVNVMEPVRGGSLANMGDAAEAVFKVANPKVSVPSWAIRFAASLPGVQVVLSGMSSMEQLKDNVATMENFKPLSDAEREVITKAVLTYRTAGAVPCTGCRYCMDCPQGIDIPRNLATYNNYLFKKERNMPGYNFGFTLEYGGMGEEEQAHNCVACRQCEEKCPQHIEISRQMELLQEVQKTVAAEMARPH